jgi:glycosyltransferase involved in cell wall biosynthesis
MRYILKKVIEESKAIVTLSEEYAQKLKLNYPNKNIQCIYNTSFFSSKDYDVVSNEMESTIEHINILSVGSLQYRKGFDLLISAFGSLPPNVQSMYTLKIAGEGEQRI